MLRVLDDADLIEFEFPDLQKFHGSRSICGLTVAYTIMRAAFDELADGQPLDRKSLHVTSAFPGPGARDGFELVTRAASQDRYAIDTSVEPTDKIAEAAKGAYYFKVVSSSASVELGLRPEIVPAEFVPLRRKQLSGTASTDELSKFRTLQFQFSDRLLSAATSEAVNLLNRQNVRAAE